MKYCKHCRVEIHQVNYAGSGPVWMHHPYPGHFSEEYRWCQMLAAEPDDTSEHRQPEG